MRKEVAALLAALAASYPRKTLVALWAEIRKLDKEEFEGLLAKHGPRPTKSTKRGRREFTKEVVTEDTPEVRIEHMLLGQIGMDDPTAIRELRAQLIRQGVDPSKIPAPQGQNIGAWLPVLFRNVPAARVMHAAREVCTQWRSY
jgi:hypothetical protein